MERIVGELGVGFANRPTATKRKKIMQMKDRLDVEEHSGVVYQIPCRDCPRHYTGQTGRRLSSRITEHKRAVCSGDPLSQVATHALEEGHEFNFASTRKMTQASDETGRELLASWMSDTNSINRHVDIPPPITRSVLAAKRRDLNFSQGCTQSRHRETALDSTYREYHPLHSYPLPPSWLRYKNCPFGAAFSDSDAGLLYETESLD
ncbi:hypothetical protein SprV_0301375400 [Sparganum proliferum]